jgi:hypothetical protein
LSDKQLIIKNRAQHSATLDRVSPSGVFCIAAISGARCSAASLSKMSKAGANGVAVQGSLSTKNGAELAIKNGLPSAARPRSFAEVGGFLSYVPDVFRRSALFVTKILQGSSPANLPIEQPTAAPRPRQRGH